MIQDVTLMVGLILLILSLPWAVAAYSEQQRPIDAALCGLAGAVLVLVAHLTHESGYDSRGAGQAFLRVLARLLP